MHFEYSVWVHIPDVTEAGCLDLMAEARYYRHVVAIAQHEQRSFSERTVRIYKRSGPDCWDIQPWPGEKVRIEGGI